MSNNTFTIWIGSEFINSLPEMPNTIIMGNFCYSGQTISSKEYPNPIGTAFKNLNLISYYCFGDDNGGSGDVDNGFAKAMADSLTKSFVFDNDSTGNAYLSSTGAEFKDPYHSGFLKQYGAKDYSYKYKTADPFMVAVSGGTFQMGNAFNVLDKEGSPIHTVSVSSFLIDKFEITFEKWTQVRNWALANGYASTDIAEGQNGFGFSDPTKSKVNNPVTTVNWYDILKWCNARSEMDGLKPVYYTSNKQDIVYRAGQITNYPSNAVNWTANGYRLPTEAEWEFAARGGTKSGNYKYSGSNTIGDVTWYAENSGSSPLIELTTHPVGQKTPNELGIYDMSGNALEWCWDLRASYPSTPQTDPKGNVGGGTNVLRGGGFNMDPGLCESANRHMQYPPTVRTFAGFRCAAN
jgi:formylglycine-generating enzyme required for sulfatase activity